MPTITYEQIATAAGVSKAAVSCALRGQSNISPRTRQRIEGVARELGYEANPLLAAHMAHLRALKKPSYRATIAFLSDTGANVPGEHELNARYLRGCQQRAAELGYKIEHVRIESGLTANRISRILISRGIQGLIIAPLAQPGGGLSLEWAKFSAVALGYSLRDPQIDRACHHNFHTMEEVLKRLMQLGYRRIGLAMSEFADQRVHHLWLGGYLAHCHYLAASAHLPPLITDEWNNRVFLRWFRKHRPDAIVSSTGKALGWLREAGLCAPQDVGFANVFWTEEQRECSGYDQNFELIGAASVDLVVGQLNRNERGIPTKPKIVLIDGDWKSGRTVRPQNGKTANLCLSKTRPTKTKPERDSLLRVL